jgi:hypothetical protein
MAHPNTTDLDLRMQEHTRRANAANQTGWQRATPPGARRRATLATFLGAMTGRLAQSTLGSAAKTSAVDRDVAVAGNSVYGAA